MTDQIDQLFASLRRGPFGDRKSGEIIGQDYGISTEPSGVAQDLYFPPESAMLNLAGLANANFRDTPPDATATIDDVTNKLPGWSFVQEVGTTITAALVADSTVGSGYKLRFTMTSGTTGHKAYLEQIIPVRSSFTQNASHYPIISINAGSSTTPNAYVQAQYLKADGSTTGSSWQSSSVTTSGDQTAPPTVQAPADASGLRIRIYAQHDGTGTDTGTRDVYEVAVVHGAPAALFSELTSPGTYGPTRIHQMNGLLRANTGSTVRYLTSKLVALPFFEAGVAAASSIHLRPVDGGYDSSGSGYPRIQVPWGGWIVGLSLMLSESITAGNMDVYVTVAGSDVWTAISNHSSLGTYATQLFDDWDAISAGDRIGVRVNTSAAFAPTTTDAAVLVWVLLDFLT